MQLGTLYGISVGTGDPELITIKGLRFLQQVPVIACPAGVKQKGIAQQIISPWLKSSQQILILDFPFVRDEAVLTAAWQTAARQVWSYLERGQDVAFACEGDVSFYSTFTYLAQTIKDLYPQVKIVTVPGVCSPMAAASELGMPLTLRQQKLVVLPALYQPEELENALDWADVVVLLKVSSVYSQVWQILQQRELLEQSWIVVKATTTEQQIYRNLRDRPSLQLPYFSLLIVRVRDLLNVY